MTGGESVKRRGQRLAFLVDPLLESLLLEEALLREDGIRWGTPAKTVHSSIQRYPVRAGYIMRPSSRTHWLTRAPETVGFVGQLIEDVGPRLHAEDPKGAIWMKAVQKKIVSLLFPGGQSDLRCSVNECSIKFSLKSPHSEKIGCATNFRDP